MASGQGRVPTEFLFGILGSAGAFLSLLGWAATFVINSPSASGENVPLFSSDQEFILAGLAISFLLGMIGSFASRRWLYRGGVIMLAAAVIGLVATARLTSGLLFPLFFPIIGFWAIVLLCAGILAIWTRQVKPA